MDWELPKTKMTVSCYQSFYVLRSTQDSCTSGLRVMGCMAHCLHARCVGAVGLYPRAKCRDPAYAGAKAMEGTWEMGDYKPLSMSWETVEMRVMSPRLEC
jgi:hypothetical protein